MRRGPARPSRWRLRVSGVAPEFVASLSGIPGTIKLLLMGDKLRIPSVRRLLVKQYGLTATISYPEYVDVVGPGVTKALALEMLLKTWGAGWADVLAIGDGENDATLIGKAGLGIAVANGVPQALGAAKFVAPSNDHDGVACTLLATLFGDQEAAAKLWGRD